MNNHGRPALEGKGSDWCVLKCLLFASGSFKFPRVFDVRQLVVSNWLTDLSLQDCARSFCIYQSDAGYSWYDPWRVWWISVTKAGWFYCPWLPIWWTSAAKAGWSHYPWPIWWAIFLYSLWPIWWTNAAKAR